MSRFPILVLTLAALGAVPAALGQSPEEHYDRIDLSASAEREIENDLLIAVVFAEVEANDQSDAADEVNRAIQWAADRAREAGDLAIETAQYNTRPVYANGRRIVGWVARQSLKLESKDAEALGELLGTLQERVAIQSVSYGLSKEARDAAEEALIAEALTQFNRRANLVARELGRGGFRMVRLSIGTSGGGPIPYRDLRAQGVAEAAVAAPALEAGLQTVSVSINGTVELDAPPPASR